ncbi:MAG: DNA polymerase Y family protein [Aquincola sp.]|nr:DNA polymerase Y family protein [Aquincola sp.]MDH4288061.1 DNA polymerase Y family protein [Aquincola sp.]MDH5328896.1 DNA polymerase Y family protein [Aquincola sp.]
MLWFALHLNGLPLEAWLATADRADGPDARPCCVVEARRVVQADERAAAAGVEPGMSAATAASLVCGLQVLARDPARESAQVERLALALSRFTPALVRQPDGVLLEVAASRRLFGGAQALWRAVRAEARAAGVRSLRMAAAPTATAASVLARVEPPSPSPKRLSVSQRLDALPLPGALVAWGHGTRLAELLHGIGCRVLGDVRGLPRTGLQRRGAAALLDVLARAHGEAPDPQPWYELPRRFELGLELLHRADDAAMLVFATQRLVQPLAGWLAQQWLAAARLTLVLRHETSVRHARPDTVVSLALGDPTRDAAQLMLLLRERLQRTVLPAPVYAIRLQLDQAVGHAGHEAPLWRERGAGAGSGEDARALFDRLAARLGPEHVQRPVLVADHRPERAMRMSPAQQTPAARREDLVPRAPRPTWLLNVPTRLAEDRGSGRPLYQGTPLALASRAERIEAGWFDGELVSRDYHLAQACDCRWLWVFRERRGAQAQWFLHGFFG